MAIGPFRSRDGWQPARCVLRFVLACARLLTVSQSGGASVLLLEQRALIDTV